MVRVLVAAGVVLLLTGAARAERLCRFEAPQMAPGGPADGPVCTGDLDDGPACRPPSPGVPLPAAILLSIGKPGLTAPAAPPLGGPGVRVLPRWSGALGAARPGFPRGIERPPKPLSA
ncbi:MAG TPA: hypothetical protein VKE22_10665 [Haliangiales bacterium]|nr:hypothetical protein [Haliangiales bacterium]